jgi:hypothetical protein
MSDPTKPSIRTIRYRFTAAGHETREFVIRLLEASH